MPSRAYSEEKDRQCQIRRVTAQQHRFVTFAHTQGYDQTNTEDFTVHVVRLSAPGAILKDGTQSSSSDEL